MSGSAFLKKVNRRSRRALAWRPQLECLEDRAVPATDFTGPVADFSSLQLDGGAYDADSILVRFHDGAEAQASAILPGATSRVLVSSLPGLQQVQLPAAVDVESALAVFRASPLVMYAEPNYQLRVEATTPNDTLFSTMWGLENTGQLGGTMDADIDATRAWDVSTGSGNVIVAVIDTGVDYTHPDLAGNMWVNAGEIAGNGVDDDNNGYVDDVHGYDFFNNDGDPMDDLGHGTHVAGTIGAVGNNGVGVTGIIWDVQIMALKFLDADGSGSEADAIEALGYAVANGATISNNSWGGDPPSQALFDAIDAARAANHLFVTAAGNGNMFGIGTDNDVSPFYPAGYNLANILVVGATDVNDRPATFSNYGATQVDLFAPGVDIRSTMPDNSYAYASGTSMAVPHVVGVAALLRDEHPTWTYSQIVSQILSTVDQLPQLQGISATGGRLNAAAALGNPEAPPAAPPTITLPVSDNFSDNLAQGFVTQIGFFENTTGRLDARPVVDNDNLEGISTLNLSAALPADFEIRTVVNADEGHVEVFGFVIRDHLTNGYVIFDYQDRFNYKFAGADMVDDRWVIGHRDATGWYTDAFVSQTLSAGTNYDLKVVIENNRTVRLTASGGVNFSHTYGDDLNDGDIGVGMRNSTAHFDSVDVRANPAATATTLPLSENFDDGIANNFVQQSGAARPVSGRYEVVPFAGEDPIHTALLSSALPQNLEMQATVNINNAAGGLLSNGLFIFDYQSATDFKFAGAYAGSDKWVIGHRDATGWVTDVSLGVPINGLTDYTLKVRIEGGSLVTLYADGVPVVSHAFTGSLTDGAAGFGAWNSIARFENFSMQEYVAPTPSSLPMTEDFADGVANHFDPRAGVWTVASGRYAASAMGGNDALSALRLTQPLPVSLQLEATVNMDAASGSLFSNSFLIFDYQSATDFKFAGAYVGEGRWIIGHRDSTGWVIDAYYYTSISALTDYDLKLTIDNDAQATLYVAGLPKVSHTFAGSLTDGKLAVGTRNAVARFDDVHVEEVLPPDPPTAGSLPLTEDFSDGVADSFQRRSGDWAVTAGRYAVAPVVGADGVSTLLLSGALPQNLEVSATINVGDASADYLSNGYLLFDYQSPTNFKFAGANAGTDQWLIGHRDASGWVIDASLTTSINALTDYQLTVRIEGTSLVTLFADGVPVLTRSYSESLTDGVLGLGTRNALARFDNVQVKQYTAPPAASLPLSENFGDGVADYFDPRAGVWTVSGGRYAAAPLGGQDALSSVRVATPLPTNVQLEATLNMDAASGGLFSNGFLIFDYLSPTDFKFAGAYAGEDRWIIGHRDSTGWVIDASYYTTIDVGTDYAVRLTIEADAIATLSVGGLPRVAYTYAGSLTDGKLALGTRNATARFDNVTVVAITSPSPPSAGSLPLTEDFADGTADHFYRRSGQWAVTGGRYEATPVVGADGISTLVLSGTLPASVEASVVVNANDATSEYLSNGFILFDYQSPTDFKFAGAYVGSDQWVIGHRTGTGWIVDATLPATINALTDYTLRVVIENSSEVSLYANGAFQVSFTFTGSVTDGQLGLGSWNAITRFDNLQVQQFVAPPAATLPHQENFNDGVADSFEVRAGAWTVASSRYAVTPNLGADGISTLRLSGALPQAVDFAATINANAGTVDRLSNALLIFDYVGPTSFKFAGAYVGSDQWVVGHRDASGWVLDAWIGGSIAENTDYNLRLVITNHTDVTLYANGVPQVAYQYTAAVTDGKLGLGSRNALSRFDNVVVQQFTAPAAAVLPHTETFDDSMADFFQVRSGTWTINSNRFAVTPTVGQDGVATLQVNDPLPPNLDLRAVINANPATTDYLSNAFIIFDYHSATDFKFAGAYVGSDQWIIGQRDASGWQVKATVNGSIDANTDYSLRVIIQNGTTASLYVNGTLRTSYNFGSNVTDGEVGLGTRNAIARFDNFVVQPYTQPGPQIQVQGSFRPHRPVSLPSGKALASVPMLAPSIAAASAPPSGLVRALDRVMSQLAGQPNALADWRQWWFALADFLASTDDN